MADRLRVDVLGRLRVLAVDGRDVTPSGALQRRLLALLVLRRGHVVPADSAIDALWGDAPPRSPDAALQNHVSRLRRALPVPLVDSVGAGYRADPALLDLDVDRLTTALAAGPHDLGASETIDAVLARWRGPAYPELDELDDARAEAGRLAELRLRAVERSVEGRMARGDPEGAIAELTALVDEEPLRERPRELLMDALARAGRSAEALRTYDDFRRQLADELGIEPSPALTARHAALLAGTTTATPAWAPASRVPIPLTSLVGRDALVAEIVARVGASRVVTLLGPGGVGKTRLATEVGLRLQAADGERPVVLCELAVATETGAVDAVAAALGIEGRPGVGLSERIATVLGDLGLQLILDNCEHVLEPVANLVELVLARCPNVRVVATSRERLRVAGEQLCPVPTMAGDAAAVDLFVERARAVAPWFSPDAAEREIVEEIVRRLDGLPLAIELAAARLHTLDVGEVAAGLDHRFDLLAGGRRTSDRHGSLQAAVSWSVDALPITLREAFDDLSVFAGPFTADQAAVVCGLGDADARVVLDQLVERSLVVRTADRRYALLETLRAFGVEQLVESGRVALARARHAGHYGTWAAYTDERLREHGRQGLAEVEAALPELRLAYDWLLAEGDLDGAAELVVGLLDYGFHRLRPDVLGWAQRVVRADPADSILLAPRVLAVCGYAAWMTGDLREAERLDARARAAGERAGDPPIEVCSLAGSIELFAGRLADARRWYAVGAASPEANPTQRLTMRITGVLPLAYAGDGAAVAAARDVLADVDGVVSPYAAYAWYVAGEAELASDPDRARASYDRALALAAGCDASFVAGVAGASRASIEARIGDPLVAARQYADLITHWRRSGVWSTQWTMLRSIAGLLARLDRPGDAATLLGAVRGTDEGHRIFGADAATLAALESQLRATLGDDAFDAAHRQGQALDGDAAADLAQKAL